MDLSSAIRVIYRATDEELNEVIENEDTYNTLIEILERLNVLVKPAVPSTSQAFKLFDTIENRMPWLLEFAKKQPREIIRRKQSRKWDPMLDDVLCVENKNPSNEQILFSGYAQRLYAIRFTQHQRENGRPSRVEELYTAIRENNESVFKQKSGDSVAQFVREYVCEDSEDTLKEFKTAVRGIHNGIKQLVVGSMFSNIRDTAYDRTGLSAILALVGNLYRLGFQDVPDFIQLLRRQAMGLSKKDYNSGLKNKTIVDIIPKLSSWDSQVQCHYAESSCNNSGLTRFRPISQDHAAVTHPTALSNPSGQFNAATENSYDRRPTDINLQNSAIILPPLRFVQQTDSLTPPLVPIPTSEYHHESNAAVAAGQTGNLQPVHSTSIPVDSRPQPSGELSDSTFESNDQHNSCSDDSSRSGIDDDRSSSMTNLTEDDDVGQPDPKRPRLSNAERNLHARPDTTETYASPTDFRRYSQVSSPLNSGGTGQFGIREQAASLLSGNGQSSLTSHSTIVTHFSNSTGEHNNMNTFWNTEAQLPTDPQNDTLQTQTDVVNFPTYPRFTPPISTLSGAVDTANFPTYPQFTPPISTLSGAVDTANFLSYPLFTSSFNDSFNDSIDVIHFPSHSQFTLPVSISSQPVGPMSLDTAMFPEYSQYRSSSGQLHI